MVKVISVHHFLSQDVLTISRPLASALAGSNILLLATDNLNVEVRDLKKAAKLSHSFHTIDHVSEIVHSPIGNYVATLEGNPGDKGAAIRIYCNWFNPKLEGVRPRIASRVTPSLRSDQPGIENMLDMIEFPHRDSPLQITVCPSTGNFMVAAVNVLVIYKYTLKVQEMSKTKFIDFEDCIHIFHNFIPKEISLIEDVIGCLSTNEVHVFKVKLVDCNDEKNLRSISMYSFSSESENGSSSLDPWTGKPRRTSNGSDTNTESTTDRNDKCLLKNITLAREEDSDISDTNHLPGYVGNVRRHPNHIQLPNGLNPRNKIILPDIERANRDYSSQGSPKIMEQTLGPKAAPPLNSNSCGHSPEVIVKLVPMASTSDQDTMIEAEAVTLVHCRLLKKEEEKCGEQFKNLKLKPVYWREFRVKRANPSTPVQPGGSSLQQQQQPHPLQSLWHPHLMSLTMCFTSTNEGFIYHLPGHIRKPGRGLGVKRVAVCPFTSPVGKIDLESANLMHALTQTGLETYTLKTSHSTVLEAEAMDNKTKACPNTDLTVCLVGLRPFLGVKDLVASTSHLVLLSCAESRDNNEKWTLYNLTLPTSLALYKNMIELANMSRSLNPHGYLELISEAHIILRAACHQLTWTMATTKDNSNGETNDLLKDTKECYQASCQLLGNYYALHAETKTETQLALPYFRMSGKPILYLLKSLMNLWKKKKEKSEEEQEQQKSSSLETQVLPCGFVCYITEIILNPIADGGEDTLEANQADLIIDILGQYASKTLASLVLKSASFRQFKSNQIRDHIRKHLEQQESFNELDALHVLAFVILSVEQGHSDVERSRTYLKSLPPGQVSEVILQHHQFLVETTGTEESLSDTASLLRDSIPNIFVEVLVSLIKSDIYSLQMVLHLLIGSLVSSSTNAEKLSNDAVILQLFLESYFIDVIDTSNSEEGAIILDGDQLQALHTLIRSYLTSLGIPVRFEEKNIDCNMFGNRYLYLDLLPPFKTSVNVKEMMMSADSPEFWCQNSLLKLQSLLCSNLCKGASCKSIVQGFLDIKPDTIGYLSLRILCLDDAKSSVPLLVDQHPEVLLPFGKEQNVDLDTWKLILKCLQDQINSKPHQHPDHESWYSSMQDILNYLAKTLVLDAFLEILPAGSAPHQNEDFQGYIQLCRRHQQSNQIQNLIVNTGHKLLSTLTF